MRLSYKICLFNLGLAIFFALIFSGGGLLEMFFVVFGAVCVVGGTVDLVVGLILLAVNKDEWGKGFLLSSGVLLLLGFCICGPVLFAL